MDEGSKLLMATGNTLLVFAAQDNEPPSSAFATLDTLNLHPVLDFDKDTDESAVFTGILPRSYAGGGITVYIHYAADGLTTGDVVWNSAFERIGDGQLDIDGDSFATANAATVTVPGTEGHVDIASIAHTDGAEIDSIAVGELFRLKITRDANAGGDTADDDVQLLQVELKET